MAIRRVNTLCVYLAVFSLLLLSSIGEAGGHRRRARQASRDTSIVASTVATVVGEQSEACTAGDCNERGTCFGTKAAPLCLCQLGYAGRNCQDTYCDSARDCNGRGWCMGTSSQFTCLCNIGFTGERCEEETPAMAAAHRQQQGLSGTTTPTPQLQTAQHQASSANSFANQHGGNFLESQHQRGQ